MCDLWRKGGDAATDHSQRTVPPVLSIYSLSIYSLSIYSLSIYSLSIYSLYHLQLLPSTASTASTIYSLYSLYHLQPLQPLYLRKGACRDAWGAGRPAAVTYLVRCRAESALPGARARVSRTLQRVRDRRSMSHTRCLVPVHSSVAALK